MWPQWQKFREPIDIPLKVNYKMAGLLPSWNHYHDSLNSIAKPIQMGSEWAHAKEVSGVPINDRIWVTDPPQSSYPACIAVKSVEIQSPAYAVDYFHSLQEALMIQNQNIASSSVLVYLAGQLADRHKDFDPFLFREDLLGERGPTEFGKDLQEAKYSNINRFPAMVIRRVGRPTLLLTGYQTSDSLQTALK
jgi:predicted DsbA family dithiol-disulfide isomerase